MPNIGSRALDDQTPGSPSDVTKLTIKNCILKSTDTYTANQNGIVQFAAGPSVSSNNVTLEQNYIETFTRTFLYAPSTNCNNWVVKDNEIRSYYFSFGPFAGNNDGYPGGLVIQGNTFNGDVPGDPPSRVNSPAGYDGLAFNAVLGDAAITENTFTKMIRGLGSVWAYGATIQGNTFTDNYLNAMALYSSDPSTPPKPPSNNVVIENNLIEYNGTPFTTEGDNPSYLSQGIWISRPAGGTTPVDASTIDINYNRFTDLGVSNSTQIWAIRQSGDGTADATNNYWGTSTNDIRVNGKLFASVCIKREGVALHKNMWCVLTLIIHPNTHCYYLTRQEALRLLHISFPTKMTLPRPASLASGPSTLSSPRIAPLARLRPKVLRSRLRSHPPQLPLWSQRRRARTWSSRSTSRPRAKAALLSSARWTRQASR